MLSDSIDRTPANGFVTVSYRYRLVPDPSGMVTIIHFTTYSTATDIGTGNGTFHLGQYG